MAAILSSAAQAQTAQEIIEQVIERDLERKSSVQNYIVNQSMMGQTMLLYYEKVQRTLGNGESISTFRLVPPNEIAERQNQNNGIPTLDAMDLEMYAQGLEQLGDGLSREINNSGLPVSSLMVPGSYDEPWASPDPRVMTGSMALFVRAAASGDTPNTDVATTTDQLNLLMDDARLLGTETVEGRPAFHIRADDVNYTQASDGAEFIVNDVSLWVDQDQYVPLRVRMDGMANMNGQPQEMFMEILSLDYEQVGPLYESMRQVMRMGGVLTPEQQAQMAEAQQQIQEMEQQLAGLSGAQRAMMENMIGPQLQMLRQMANNGTMEFETRIDRIRVNAGLPDQAEIASSLFGGATGFPGASAGAFTPSSPGASAVAAEPQVDPAAQQACLQEKIEAAQAAAQPRRRGIGGLLGGIGQAVSQLSNLDIGGLAGSLYGPDASDEDIEARARELGLTEQDLADCRTP